MRRRRAGYSSIAHSPPARLCGMKNPDHRLPFELQTGCWISSACAAPSPVEIHLESYILVMHK